MKKVLFATVAAVMSTTAAMADVGFSEGRITALMTAANNFESRGINIVENSNKLAVHKTVTAWNKAWNAAEGDNSVDLDAVVSMTELRTTTHGTITTETSNIEISADGSTATYTNGLGISVEIQDTAIQMATVYNVSLRDSRADEVELVHNQFAVDYHIGSVSETGSDLVVSIRGNDSFDELVDRVEAGIQDAYDSGFEDGYSAGYDDGFAAAKSVVKN